MTEALTARIPARSAGLKLLLVCAVALLMSLMALFVFGILNDRTNRARQVVGEISQLIGGPQTFAGPMLAAPYTIPGTKDVAPQNGVYVVFPERGAAKADVKTELRRRGLFSAPVWKGDIDLVSTFDLTGAEARAPTGAVLRWAEAEFLVGVSDPRGAQADVVLNAGGTSLPMAPASLVATSAVADSTEITAPARNFREARGPGGMRFFGAPAGGIAAPGAKFEASTRLRYAGAQRLAVLAWGKSTTFEAKGDWADPSFDGSFLPVRKTGVGEARKAGDPPGFTAAWSVPYVARGVAGQGTDDVIARLGATSLGVSFVEKTNPYQSVSRSLKYAPMFIGLVFLAYFMFETTQRRRVHPAQYVLIGLAQLIFYMLLLSFAERVGFDLGFLIAAGATVALISAYAGWVFESRRQGFVALAAFTVLYGLIYVLMRLEDLALLVGAVASFAAIAAVMYFTRRIDWYGQAAPQAKPAV
jgi:inner membrane protein